MDCREKPRFAFKINVAPVKKRTVATVANVVNVTDCFRGCIDFIGFFGGPLQTGYFSSSWPLRHVAPTLCIGDAWRNLLSAMMRTFKNKGNIVEIISNPTIGDAFEYRGRTLTVHAVRDHVTREGREIVLIKWKTSCLRCGVEMIYETTANLDRVNLKCRECIKEHKSWRPRDGSEGKKPPVDSMPNDVRTYLSKAQEMRYWNGSGQAPSNWIGWLVAPFVEMHPFKDKRSIHESLEMWVAKEQLKIAKRTDDRGRESLLCEVVPFGGISPNRKRTSAATSSRQGKIGGVYRADALLRKF